MDQNSTLASVVSDRPSTARILQRYGLDFCCGGEQTLYEACSRAHLDAGRVLSELEQAAEPAEEIDVSALSQSELVHHIVRRYHEPLRPELARLLELARKAARVHGDKTAWPKPLLPHLEASFSAIEDHLCKEERILFPAIELGRGFAARMPISVMMREHEDHGANLELIRELTDGFRPPAEACATWRILYHGLEELDLELKKHIHLENNLLFPRALRSEGDGG
jgi:regulator of cell morphogenesis and NO signaling